MPNLKAIKINGVVYEIEGGGSGTVTGVKGNTESTYRTGNVNLTPANIGALPDTTPIPSKTSDLTNDSGYYSENDSTETTLDDADKIPFYDDSASTTSKRRNTTWSNIKAKLKTYFDSLYSKVTSSSANGYIRVDNQDVKVYEVPTGYQLMDANQAHKLADIEDGAEVNQNAFSNVKVGSTTVQADSKTDTLEFVAGSNITLTPDATNDKITIASSGTDTATWGQIGGTLSNQTDLNTALSGKASDTPTFTEPSTRTNIASGESVSTLFGKIKKWFTDLKDLAFIAKDGTSSTK